MFYFWVSIFNLTIEFYPAMVAEWSKTLISQIQEKNTVARSQVQIPFEEITD